MLLAIDVGNTNISCGIFKGQKLENKFDIPTRAYSKTKLAKRLGAISRISDSLICSVVPKLTKIIQHDLKLLTGRNPLIIGKDLIVPIKNHYHKPKQVGQDRLVNAYAACTFYSAPVIVIDSGTAITFDIISKNKAYLGGLIFPGMKISLSALAEKTALLPLVRLEQPKVLIGQDTPSSILSGIVFGTAVLTREVTKIIQQRIGKNVRVIGTGGNIFLIKKYSGMKMKINKDLTLKGINLVYKKKI
jgi:type III pantothenate kinase